MSTKRKAEDQESEAIKKAKKLAEEEEEAEGKEEEGEEESEDDLDGEDGEGEEDDDLDGNYLYTLLRLTVSLCVELFHQICNLRRKYLERR